MAVGLEAHISKSQLNTYARHFEVRKNYTRKTKVLASSDSVAAKQAPWGKKRQLICLAAAVAAAAILLTGTEGFSIYDLDRLV